MSVTDSEDIGRNCIPNICQHVVFFDLFEILIFFISFSLQEGLHIIIAVFQDFLDGGWGNEFHYSVILTASKRCVGRELEILIETLELNID